MECPICGSKAITASACISNYVELAQQGHDPYDLIYEHPKAECRTCGHIFSTENQPETPASSKP